MSKCSPDRRDTDRKSKSSLEDKRRLLEGPLKNSAVARLLVEGKLPDFRAQVGNNNEARHHPPPIDLSNKRPASPLDQPAAPPTSSFSSRGYQKLTKTPDGSSEALSEKIRNILTNEIQRTLDAWPRSDDPAGVVYRCNFCHLTIDDPNELLEHYCKHIDLPPVSGFQPNRDLINMCLDQQRELGHLNSSGNSSTSYGTTRAGTPNCTGVVKRSSTPRSPDALRKLLLKPSNVSPDYQSGTNSNSNLNRKIKSAGKLSAGSPKATATSGFRKHKQNFKSESGDCWNRNRTISCGEVVQRNEYDLLPSSPMSVAAGHEYDTQLSRKAGVMADVRIKMEPDRMESPTLSRSSSGYALVEPPPEDQFYGMELRRATDGRFYDRPIQLPVLAIQLPVGATQFPHRRTPITCDDGSQPDCREDTSSDFGSGSCVTVDIASPSQPLDYRNESSVSPTPSISGECRNWRLVQPTPVQVQNFQTQQKLLDAKPEEVDDIVCTENFPPSRTAATVAGGVTEDPDRPDQNPIQNAIKHSSTADYDDYNIFRKFKRFRKCEPTTVTDTDNVIETGHVTGARHASDTELTRDTVTSTSVTNTTASPSCASSSRCLVSNYFSDIDQTPVRERSPEISSDCIVFKKNDATSGLNDAISGLNDTTSGSNDAYFGPNNTVSGPNDASVQCSLLPKVSTRDIAVECLLLESNPELTTEFSSMDLSSSYNVTLDEIDAAGSHLKREPEQDSLYSGTPDGLSLATDCCNRCNFCGITFDDDVIYSIHMGCHSHRDPFICNLCGRRCNGKYAFNTHIVRGHQSA